MSTHVCICMHARAREYTHTHTQEHDEHLHRYIINIYKELFAQLSSIGKQHTSKSTPVFFVSRVFTFYSLPFEVVFTADSSQGQLSLGYLHGISLRISVYQNPWVSRSLVQSM